MSSSITYSYFGKINIEKNILNQCLDLLNMEETIPKTIPDEYEHYIPEQVGFYKKHIPTFFIPGIDIEKSTFNIILQKPGRMLPWHIDKFDGHKDIHKTNKVRTYLCFLEDWVPGQIFGTELDTYTHWKAGDTICWDYLVWHFSSNASLKPKCTLQIQEGYD